MTKTITVKGIGNIAVKPDLVELTMVLEAKDKVYERAMNRAADQLAHLNESLQAVGFEKSSVKTTKFNVDTEYYTKTDKAGNRKQIFLGFVCRHHLKLSFDFDMGALSRALGAIAEGLMNPELRISFTVKDSSAVKEELLRDATVNAKRKAEILCEASGVQMGQLLTIDYNWSEINIYSNTNYYLQEASMAAYASGPAISMDIEPDDIRVSDTVSFVWEIQ